MNSLFEALPTDAALTRFFSQRGLGVISIAQVAKSPEQPEADFMETTRRHVIDGTISLAVPYDWEIWDPPDDVLFIAAAPEKGQDEIQPHFFVTKEPNRWDSSRGYMIGSIVALRNLEGYAEHEIFEFEVDACPIACVSYDAPVDEWVFTNRQYMFVFHDWAYLITCKMLTEQARRWSGVFDNIARSLQLIRHDD